MSTISVLTSIPDWLLVVKLYLSRRDKNRGISVQLLWWYWSSCYGLWGQGVYSVSWLTPFSLHLYHSCNQICTFTMNNRWTWDEIMENGWSHLLHMYLDRDVSVVRLFNCITIFSIFSEDLSSAFCRWNPVSWKGTQVQQTSHVKWKLTLSMWQALMTVVSSLSSSNILTKSKITGTNPLNGVSPYTIKM